MHTSCPQDVRVSNQPIFEALGDDIDTWGNCVTSFTTSAAECPNGYGLTLALPTSVPSTARMNLTTMCFPLMAAIIGFFFTYSPKHLVVWKAWFAMMRPKAEVRYMQWPRQRG
jgi:hypothetical protein